MQNLRNNNHGHSKAFATVQYYVRKNYIPTQWCRKIDGSQSRLPWHLLTPNLNCGKHNARSKHVEPHLGYSYASQSTFRSSLQRHHILVHGSFFMSSSFCSMKFAISLCNPIADESSTLINEVNASTSFSSDDGPSSCRSIFDLTKYFT